MRHHRRPIVIAALLFAPSILHAQAVDPSGHWEGTIDVPDHPATIAIDVARNAKGDLAGTLSNAAQNVRGLPFGKVTLDGKTIHFVLNVGSGGGTFDGVISDDGRSIAGKYGVAQQGYSIPFSLTRTGEAMIEAPPKSAPIGKEFEGTWNGTLDVNGTPRRLILKMSNQSDGTSMGTLVSVDGGGLEVPVMMAQKGQSLRVEAKMVAGTFSGLLSGDGKELVGTWTQGVVTFPLSFSRGPK